MLKESEPSAKATRITEYCCTMTPSPSFSEPQTWKETEDSELGPYLSKYFHQQLRYFERVHTSLEAIVAQMLGDTALAKLLNYLHLNFMLGSPLALLPHYF